jgi:energy-coupling factor transporter ATP-binding protein EcfA2
VLKMYGVSYRYPGTSGDTLHGVSLELAEGHILGLTGPTDAGKSTLCLVAGGLAPRVVGGTVTGDISIDGVDVRKWPMYRLAEHVVTGLQDPAGQLSQVADTVFEEVAFGPANMGLPRNEVIERSGEALTRVGIESLRERDPGRLSGGQQQLVVIAGLLAIRPRHLVLDEPVSHLDAESRRLVLDALRRIAADGTAVLIAEGRSEALVSVCDSLAVIAAGNIVARGPARDVLHDDSVIALGVEELPEDRLRRRLREAGLDPAALDAAAPDAIS